MNLPPKVQLSGFKIATKLARDYTGFLMDCHLRYGDFFRMKIGRDTIYVVSHPDALKHVLQTKLDQYPKNLHGFLSGQSVLELCNNYDESLFLTNDKEVWRKGRLAMAPAYTSERFNTYTPKLFDNAKTIAKTWENDIEKGRPIRVRNSFFHLAFRNMEPLLFEDCDLNSDTFTDNWMLLLRLCGEKVNSLNKLKWVLPTRSHRLMKQCRSYVYSELDRLVRTRIESGKIHTDVMGGLIESFKDSTENDDFIPALSANLSSFHFGSVTTCSALNSAFAVLSQHPSAKATLLNELETVLKGEAPTFESIQQLAYMKRFVAELLRFRTPDVTTTKRATQDDEIMGYDVPKGTPILVNFHAANHHPDFWENPEGFDPDRFIEKRFGQDNPYAYVPFSGGPQKCCGVNFSQMQIYTALAAILPKYQLSLLPGKELTHKGPVIAWPNEAEYMHIRHRS